MLMGTELQHHVLQRGEAASGRLRDWDRVAFSTLKEEFAKEIKAANELPGKLPLAQFQEVWRAVQAEFSSDEELQELFTIPTPPEEVGEKKPISINTRTVNMPIETMGGQTLVNFKLPKDPKSMVEDAQKRLEERLQGLTDFKESIQAQEEGYYYENYGLLNQNTLEKLFSVTPQHNGVGGLTKEQVGKLFTLMLKDGWLQKVDGIDNKYQLTAHPREFYSSAKITGALTEMGFDSSQMHTISERLEIFMYQTAVMGGSYSIKEGARDELVEMVKTQQEKCNIEYLLAKDKIESTLATASSEISMADLNTAYLLNNYKDILQHFPEKDRAQVRTVLNNAMTRLLFYKTELDHLNDIQAKFSAGQDSSAVAMLHTRRNYQLDKLLTSGLDQEAISESASKIEQDRKMQRAFLLFESEFGHRCNARQVNIFRGLLLDDVTDPDKIDSAQARMGFGKTTLLPLVALYKTGGDKLVRFIVPKSALETNTADMSNTLTNILGRRAIRDDFKRYRIATDPVADMGEDSPRLKSLEDARADLQKRLILYKRIRENREVLVQAPNVRNSLECQAKIFLDMMPRLTDPLQQKKLLECITLLNEIRSLNTVSVFDELDATQDPATTEVNYTSGEKVSLDTAEIYPLELITQTIGETEDKSVENLGEILLNRFGITDSDGSILKFITSLEENQPSSITPDKSTPIYLIRSILTDPIMFSIFTEKEAGTDFGVWFENAKDGSKLYDYNALRTGSEPSKTPLLIAIPYSAANTPKPQGSRFDNPEVTAITTMLYYLDSRTEINEVPHLEFLIDSFRKGIGETPFLDPKGERLDPQFAKLFNDITALAEIEDPLIRNEARKKYFAGLNDQIKSGAIEPNAFRKMLARTVVQEQIKFDAGKANSNRYEQGNPNDVVIGFSGTAGDTSSHFKENMLDPAADGNMTLGIMGRDNCQGTTPLDITGFSERGEDYTTSLIKQLTSSFTANTRTLIDVGGLCKTSNRTIAKELALQLKKSDEPSLNKLKGVIFYDDVTNMKKLLVLDSNNKEKIVDLTPQMVAESDREGSYFTYYDQSHSRGADIKQMDKAHAVLTLNFNVTNNDYKQAIMRMRKIVDKLLGQSFSTAVPEQVRKQIISDLKLKEHTLTGNDIALWLRQKELKNDLNNVSVIMMELDSIIKNAVLQQQAELTKQMSEQPMTEKQIAEYTECIKKLNEITPFISGSSADLQEKYGKVYGKVKKEDFVRDLHESFEKRLTTLFVEINRTRKELGLPVKTDEDKVPYQAMEKGIIKKRDAQLSPEFIIPSSTSSLAEAQSESESQSESQSQSQSQSQTQTHSFSEVATEEVVSDDKLRKHEGPLEPASIDYLSSSEKVNELALASKIPNMEHLYSALDPVRCSPAYNGEPIPPVRYFLAREEGNPKVILLNQDEANLFKSSPVSPWSLYDVSLKKSGTLNPLSGPIIESLKDPLLKKLYFSAFQYQVTGADIPTIAQSLEVLCTPEQLIPTLNVKYESAKNVSAEEAIFTLPKWGFYGGEPQNIQINIEQTRDKFKDKYGKTGITISVGEGQEKSSVFISSKLNKRILAEVEKQEKGLVPPDHSKLKKIAEQISQEYDAVRKERKEIYEIKKDCKAEKKKVIEEADKVIAALEQKKAEAIRLAKADIDKDFVENMKNVVNLRKAIQNKCAANWDTMCKLKVGDSKEFGITIFGKNFPNLDKAVAFGLSQLYQEHKKNPMSAEELEKKLDGCINAVFNAFEERYQKVADYQNKTKTALEELHDGSTASTPLTREKVERILRNEMQDLRSAWQDPKGGTPEAIHKKWNQFVDIVENITNSTGESLSQEEFHQKIVEGVKQFAKENNMDAEKTLASIVPRLIYSLTPGDTVKRGAFMSGFLNEDPNKVRNIAATKVELNNYVKRVFAKISSTPSEEQAEFYSAINALSKKKMASYDYEIVKRLLDFNKIPVSREEVKQAVKEVLTKLNVRTVETEVNSLTDQCISYLAGRKAIEGMLDRFKPIDGRTLQLESVDGVEPKMFQKNFERLAKLDREVLAIQKEIDDAKSVKKNHVKKLDERLDEERGKLRRNSEVLDELRTEKSAIRKLLSGLTSIQKIFTNRQVKLDQTDSLDFLDRHFDLGTIIRSEASASATLTFTPPEVYKVEKDMQVQLEHMHGVDESSEIESPCKKSLDRAIRVVREQSGMVMERELQIEHVLQINQEEHAEEEITVGIDPVTPIEQLSSAIEETLQTTQDLVVEDIVTDNLIAKDVAEGATLLDEGKIEVEDKAIQNDVLLTTSESEITTKSKEKITDTRELMKSYKEKMKENRESNVKGDTRLSIKGA